MSQEEKTLSTKVKISFALGNIGGLAIGQSSILLLYTYYFLYVGVPLHPIILGLILMIYGIWDAINEPIIGHISDFTKSRWGRRKPFIMGGIIPLIIFGFLIYTPPLSDSLIAAIYLIVMLFLYDTFVTMVVTMWFSLFLELSLKQEERLSASKYLQIFGVLGLIFGLGIAPLIAGSFSEPGMGYSIMGLAIGILTAVSVLPTILFVKERIEYQIQVDQKIKFTTSLKEAFKSKSFIYYVLVQFLLQLSYSLVLSSLPLFFEGVLGLQSIQWALELLLVFVVVIPSLYFWIKIASNKGTKYALFYSMLSFSAVFPFIFLVFNPITMMVLLLLAGIGLAGVMLFPTILLSDVIDEDQLNTNSRREGLYNGVSGVIVKLANSISWLVLGVMVALFEIDRDNLNPSNITLLNEIGLRISVGLLPVIMIIIGLFFLHKYPLAGGRLKEVKEKVKILNEELMKNID
jgi:GPH family glycoside/pentoside/hexuronide:cation symporter